MSFIGSQPSSSLSADAPVFHPLLPAPHPVPQWVLSSPGRPTGSNTKSQATSVHRDNIANPNWSKIMMSRSFNVNRQKKQGRSSTPSSNGSVTSSQKVIQKGLQGAIREYLQAPLASTLPCPEFPMGGLLPSTSSIWLEEGLRQMSDQALSEGVSGIQEEHVEEYSSKDRHS